MDKPSRVERFAEGMKKIPRRIQHCEVYGTPSVVVDEKHAKNIFKQVVPTAMSHEIYRALVILQDRLDGRSG